MAKQRSHRRRRHRRHSLGLGILYRVLSVVVISVVIIAALTLFFRVDTITVSGQTQYSKEEITNASGISVGSSLFLLNKYDIADRIVEKMPYVSSVRIHRKLPDTLVIEVTDSALGGQISQDGAVYVLSADGKVIGKTTPEESDGQAPEIRGIVLENPQIGKPGQVNEESQGRWTDLVFLLSVLNDKGMLQGVAAIDLTGESCLTMDYDDRFTVKIAYGADFNYKIANLSAVLDRLEDNETGTIDLTIDGQANVIPNER